MCLDNLVMGEFDQKDILKKHVEKHKITVFLFSRRNI